MFLNYVLQYEINPELTWIRSIPCWHLCARLSLRAVLFVYTSPKGKGFDVSVSGAVMSLSSHSALPNPNTTTWKQHQVYHVNSIPNWPGVFAALSNCDWIAFILYIKTFWWVWYLRVIYNAYRRDLLKTLDAPLRTLSLMSFIRNFHPLANLLTVVEVRLQHPSLFTQKRMVV